MQIITFAMLCVLLLFTLNKLKKSLFYLMPFIYLSVSIYTFVGTEYLNFATNVPFHFFESLSDTEYQNIYFYYLFASFSFILGIMSCKNADILISFKKEKVTKFTPKVQTKYILALYVITILFVHMGNGIENLYYREGYESDGSGITAFRILYTMTLPLTCLLLPFLRFKLARYLLISILFIIVQGTCSRNLVLLPACYYIGVFLRDQKISIPKGIITLILIVFSVNIAMQYRDNQIQGVIPNIIFYYKYGLDYTITEYAINYLSSFSVYASALTIHEHQFNFSSFIASVNPLPSRYIDIDGMIESQRLNKYAPFPAIGMLALGGPLVVFTYYYLAAVIWSLFGSFVASKSKVLSVATLMLFILFCFLSLQYNLRSVTRLLYYLILIAIILKLISIIKFNFIEKYRIIRLSKK
ncbi:hypothetical protein [Pseudocolwellia agarivorans]|uniref:hypothetical protein n=1 Tax=Pseudocolwellia agarivorans TaxID=1911682 RepID=UPI003F884707